MSDAEADAVFEADAVGGIEGDGTGIEGELVFVVAADASIVGAAEEVELETRDSEVELEVEGNLEGCLLVGVGIVDEVGGYGEGAFGLSVENARAEREECGAFVVEVEEKVGASAPAPTRMGGDGAMGEVDPVAAAAEGEACLKEWEVTLVLGSDATRGGVVVVLRNGGHQFGKVVHNLAEAIVESMDVSKVEFFALPPKAGEISGIRNFIKENVTLVSAMENVKAMNTFLSETNVANLKGKAKEGHVNTLKTLVKIKANLEHVTKGPLWFNRKRDEFLASLENTYDGWQIVRTLMSKRENKENDVATEANRMFRIYLQEFPE